MCKEIARRIAMRKGLGIYAVLLSLYLGLCNGRIALWDSEQPKPLHTFPYRAALYPEMDRKALEQGIPISDKESITKLLEDYLS